jgi:DHA1 family bicyclomycin/chloramphenicol resistance-like MFS transporter
VSDTTGAGEEGRRSAPVSVVYLMIVTSVAVTASTIYTPSLPYIAIDLATSQTLAQASLTAFIMTFGIVQIWHGPASDRLGRWRVLAGSLAVFVVGTGACALAPNIWVLIAGRMLQGLGAAGVAVLPRAIARDIFDRKDTARVFTYLSMAASLTATASPLIGGALQSLTGNWRIGFVILGLLALWVLFLSFRRAPYLARGSAERPPGLTGYMADYLSLMRRPHFAFNVIGGGFMRASYFAFIGAVPFVLSNAFGTPAASVGLIMVSLTAAFLCANLVVVRIADRFRPESMVVFGTTICIFAPIGMALLALAGAGPVIGIAMPVAVFGFGNGFALPMVNALAVNADPRMAGAGSSLLGFWGYAMGAGGTLVAGFLAHDDALPLAILLSVTTILGLVCFVIARACTPAETDA